jgi:hypothetical protein
MTGLYRFETADLIAVWVAAVVGRIEDNRKKSGYTLPRLEIRTRPL